MGDLFEYQNILEAVQCIAKDLAEIKAKLFGQPAAPAVAGMQAEPALPKFKKGKGSRRPPMTVVCRLWYMLAFGTEI